MAKCISCNQRKGKRACPALQNDICPLCCAKKRQKEISCPATCSWLGGLAVLSGEAAQPSTAAMKRAHEPALDRFQRWQGKRDISGRIGVMLDSFEIYLDEQDDDDDWRLPLALAHLWYGEERDGSTLLADYLAQSGASLKPAEAGVLKQLNAAWCSVFEVVEVELGSRMKIHDLLAETNTEHGSAHETKFWVDEVEFTYEIEVGEVICSWIFQFGERTELTGAQAHLPARYQEKVVEDVKAELADVYLDESRPISDRVRSAEIAIAAVLSLNSAVNGAWSTPEAEPTLPRYEALFRVHDVAEVLKRLRAHAELKEEEGGLATEFAFQWERPGQSEERLADESLFADDDVDSIFVYLYNDELSLEVDREADRIFYSERLNVLLPGLLEHLSDSERRVIA